MHELIHDSNASQRKNVKTKSKKDSTGIELATCSAQKPNTVTNMPKKQLSMCLMEHT